LTILLVEDDAFKAADIIRALEEVDRNIQVEKAASVTSALRLITKTDFALVILDMSLSTFDLSGPGGGGSPQSQGGIEVLRLAKRIKREAKFIVVIFDISTVASQKSVKPPIIGPVRELVIGINGQSLWAGGAQRKEPINSVRLG
jgi:CheY-like chemotaxis protein